MSNGKNKKRTILMSALIALVVIVIFVACFTFVATVNDLVSTTILSNIQEIAEHDDKSILSSIQDRWARLEQIGLRMGMYSDSFSDSADLQTRIAAESNTTTFDSVYFITPDGDFYSSDFTSGNLERDEPAIYAPYEFHKRDDNSDTFIARVDKRLSDSSMYQLIVYGSPIEEFSSKDGVRYSYILGMSTAEKLQNEVSVSVFDGRGATGLIGPQGYYIINPSLETDETVTDEAKMNFVAKLRGCKNGEALANEVVGIITNIQPDDYYFYNSYELRNGERYHFLIRSVTDTDFFLCIEVSDSVFAQLRTSYLIPSFILVMMVTVALIVLVCLFLSARRSAIRSEAQAEARTEFLSTMSHEIRTPLNGLIGLNYLMKTHVDDREKMENYLEESSTTAQYLLSLVNDILDVSKLRSGKFMIDKAPFDLSLLIENVCVMQRDAAASKGIAFEERTNVKERYLIGDEVRVKQVLVNILGNALKFTGEGGKIVLETEQDENDEGSVLTTFRVTDTGCGMSKEFLGHVFDAFAQERGKITSSQKGTGLGMSISYLLVKQMGGEIKAESELDVGSTFTVTISFARANPPEPQEEPQRPVKKYARPLHVLLVEDNALNSDILTEILTDEGFTVDCAANGQEALDAFLNSEIGSFDLILMDMRMPVMSGCEATRKIRASGRKDAATVKIFACTANSFKEDIEEAYASGMNDFLAKPVDIPTLLEKIES